jgi:tetratricopeptide (TPR) repeat protein
MSRIVESVGRSTVKALFIKILVLTLVSLGWAQSGLSTRQRRVIPQPSQPVETPAITTSSRNSTPATDPATSSIPNSSTRVNTLHAYSLLEQKQYEAALKEAKMITAADPKNSEAFKIAGFAELNLNRFEEAASDLQKALDLQRAAKEEDPNTVNALAQSYIRLEKYENALPLLVSITTRTGAKVDPLMLYYRGLSEFKTGKVDDAAKSFNDAIKADPKNALSLYYLGRIAFDKNSLDTAVAMLNRATMSDARLVEAWSLLSYAYLNRAASATGIKADTDYASAIRAAENLIKVRKDEATLALLAQALIRAKQFPRAITTLEPLTTNKEVQGSTLYLLGMSYIQTKNFPKAIATLEQAATKTPDDLNIYRYLGYAYEVSKQYANALTAYEKGLKIAPDTEDIKQSAERVRPFANK